MRIVGPGLEPVFDAAPLIPGLEHARKFLESKNRMLAATALAEMIALYRQGQQHRLDPKTDCCIACGISARGMRSAAQAGAAYALYMDAKAKIEARFSPSEIEARRAVLAKEDGEYFNKVMGVDFGPKDPTMQAWDNVDGKLRRTVKQPEAAMRELSEFMELSRAAGVGSLEFAKAQAAEVAERAKAVVASIRQDERTGAFRIGTVEAVCDCGGERARTTHSDWCSSMGGK